MHDSGDGGSLAYGLYLAQTLVALTAVGLVTIAARRWIGRWQSNAAASTGLRVVDRVTLEPRRNLYVVEGPNVRLLVGSSEGGLHVLHRWPPTPRSSAVAWPGWQREQRTLRNLSQPHRGRTTESS
jgi:flagellar biogenesis protein FliO